LADPLLDVRRRLVDGDDDGAGGRIRLLPGVDAVRREAHGALLGKDHCSRPERRASTTQSPYGLQPGPRTTKMVPCRDRDEGRTSVERRSPQRSLTWVPQRTENCLALISGLARRQ